MSEFKYFSHVLDELETDDAECRKKVTSGHQVPVFSNGLVLLKAWKTIRFLKGCMWKNVWVVA